MIISLLFRWLTILVALLALLIGILDQFVLPKLIDRITRIESDGNNMGIERLKIGHAMAGGGSAGTKAMTDAIRKTLWAQVFGVSDTKSRLAWRKLTDTLGDAERLYLSPSWGFGLGPDTMAMNEIAEGLRYVSHVTKLALDVYLEDSPRMVRMLSPTLKLLGDNPDAIYYMSTLEVDNGKKKEFLVEGCRGEREIYISLSIHAPSTKGGEEREEGYREEKVVSDINDKDIQFDNDGCYRIYLSPNHMTAKASATTMTWLKIPHDATTLITRHYFSSTTKSPTIAAAFHEEVKISIRQASPFLESDVNAEAFPATTTTSDIVIAKRITKATNFIRRHTILLPKPDPTTAPPFFALLPNTIGMPQTWKQADMNGYGAVDIAYAGGRFLLTKEEALIIKGVVPINCRFANVVLWNRYLQTFDYGNNSNGDYPVFQNLLGEVPFTTTKSEVSFTLVLSHLKPPPTSSSTLTSYKWLYNEGRSTGTVFFRFLVPDHDDDDSKEFTQIETEVIPFNEINKYFTKNSQD